MTSPPELFGYEIPVFVIGEVVVNNHGVDYTLLGLFPNVVGGVPVQDGGEGFCDGEYEFVYRPL